MSGKSKSNDSENETLPALKELLKQLEFYASKVRSEPQEMKTLLTGICSHRFIGDTVDEVMKVYESVVYEAVQIIFKVNLSEVHTSLVKKDLCHLLEIDEKTLDKYFPQTHMLQNASSPLDMAEHLQKKNVPQWFIENLFNRQFQIRWNTQSQNGEPNDYTYYQFCDKENTTELLKYIPRRAHVNATLYKECRKKSVVTLRAITKGQLCPKVYIRVAGGWKSWQADEQQQQQQPPQGEDEDEEEGEYQSNDVTQNENDLSWIYPSIRKFITENADEQTVDNLNLALSKPTLYWAVLEDRDFIPVDNPQLKPIGKTQIYVGKADNGIRRRWINGNNHCAMMKKCLDNVCAMTTYDPLRLKGIQLVDARLALAKVRGEKTALFVIKTFGDDVEKVEIALQKVQKAEASLESLPEANATIEEAKKSLSEASESCCQYFIKIETSLLQAYESCHEVIDAAKKSLLEDCKSCCEFLTNAQNNLYEAEKCLCIFIFYSKVQESLRHVKIAKHFATTTLQQLKEEVKKRMDEWYEETAKKELEEAEKRHRHGKRVDNTEIIHDDDIKWLPKDMKYGMNKI